MKTGIRQPIYLLSVFFIAWIGSCRSGSQEEGVTFVPDADHIQVVLFHLAQRCGSCNAVEAETMLLLEEEYEEEVNSGKVRFVPLNFQSDNGKKAAQLLQASGQTLFVVMGDSITDLTSAAFMFGPTLPERYRNALRETLDKYLE